MTLIKSTDGSGWVEARCGDIVTGKDSQIPVKIIRFGDNGCIWVLLPNGNEFVLVANTCQLIERPFQVGDVVKHKGLWYVVRNTHPFTIESADNPLLIGVVKPEDCQLIERPVGGV